MKSAVLRALVRVALFLASHPEEVKRVVKDVAAVKAATKGE